MNTWWLELQKVMLNPWAAVGFLGQALFFSRWIVQWLASEKRKASYVPFSFWLISLTGGIMVAIYAIQRQDAVFLLGQTVGIFSYVRNIILLSNNEQNSDTELAH